MTAGPPSPAGPLRAGAVVLALLAAGMAFWSATVELGEAVVLPGQVVPSGGARPVQHPQGGRVASVLVQEGTQVPAGAVLVRLHDPALDAEAAAVGQRLRRVEARLARLRAEAAGAALPEWPPELQAAAAVDAALAEILEQEQSAFTARRARIEAQERQLAAEAEAAARIAAALAGQADAAAEQAALISAELVDQERLLAGGLTQAARVNALRREAARLRGVMAEATAARERALAAADVAAHQAALLRATEADRVRSDLPEQEALREDLAVRRAALAARIAAQTLRAPVAGVVQGLAVAGPGAVLGPGASALHILPDDAAPVVAAVLPPGRVEAVAPGMTAEILLAPGPDGVPRRLAGLVTALSPDPAAAPGLPARFHRLEVAPLPGAGQGQMRPGMAAEVRLSPGAGAAGTLAVLAAPLERAFARPGTPGP